MKNNNIVTKSGNLMGDSVIVNGDRFDIRSVIYTIRGVQVMLDRIWLRLIRLQPPCLIKLSNVMPIAFLKGSAFNCQKKKTTF